MKRAGNLLEAIAERENLRLAAFKALRGKRAMAGRSLLDGIKRGTTRTSDWGRGWCASADCRPPFRVLFGLT